MRAFIVILACCGVVATSVCPVPSVTEKNYRNDFYVVEFKLMSKQEKNGDFVYEVEVEKYIKAPFVGGLWGPGVVHNAPKTITVPKTCQSSKRHQPGVTYTAMGKDNQYYVMKRSDKLNDQEKRFLNILKGQGQ